MQRASAKLLLASGSHLCQHAVCFMRRVSVITASRKQTSCKGFYSVYSRFCCPGLQLTLPLMKCRWKSGTGVNAADHFVELGLPQLEDDVDQLAANITARNMNIDVSELVRLFLWPNIFYAC